MNAGLAARNQVTLVGYAHSQIERHATAPLGVTGIDTARAAIADAGLRPEQIDGFVAATLLPTAGAHAIRDGVTSITPGWMAAHLGVESAYTVGFQGIGQIPGSLSIAVNAVATGAADYVLFHRALHNPVGKYHDNPMQRAEGHDQWTAPQGFFGPLAGIALPYNEYLQRYGAKRESMAHVVVEARKNGARLPWSVWHDRPLTIEQYLEAPVLTDPINRLDCDMPVDGVACFVLTSAERAKDLPNKPVYVSGYALSSYNTQRLPMHWPLDDIMGVGAETVKRLWVSAGIGPNEVDFPQVYDGFSPWVWFWLELLGICPVGEAHQWVADGHINSDDHDAVPALSGGGALGNGRMHGVPQMLECYLQLAGRAGTRQRPDPQIAVACGSAPHFGGAVVYSASTF